MNITKFVVSKISAPRQLVEKQNIFVVISQEHWAKCTFFCVHKWFIHGISDNKYGQEHNAKPAVFDDW